jgi:hypothetical protein
MLILAAVLRLVYRVDVTVVINAVAEMWGWRIDPIDNSETSTTQDTITYKFP